MPIGILFGGREVKKRGREAVDDISRGQVPFGDVPLGVTQFGQFGPAVAAPFRVLGKGSSGAPAQGPSKEAQKEDSDAKKSFNRAGIGGLRGTLMQRYGVDFTGGLRGGQARNPNTYGQGAIEDGGGSSGVLRERLSNVATKWWLESRGSGLDPIAAYNQGMGRKPKAQPQGSTRGGSNRISREDLRAQIDRMLPMDKRGLPLDPLDPRVGELVRQGMDYGYISRQGAWV